MEQGVKNMEIIIKGLHIEAVAPGFVDSVRKKVREELENPTDLIASLNGVTRKDLPSVKAHFAKVGSPDHVWPRLLNLALAKAIEASAADLKKPLTPAEIRLCINDTCIAVTFSDEEKEIARALQGNIPAITGLPMEGRRTKKDHEVAFTPQGCF